MVSLLGMVAAMGLSIAFYMWRRSSLPHSRMEAMAFTCLYCLALGLALRFGGRTYPGIHFPDSALLNWLLNGNRFSSVGYLTVMLAWTADTLRILLGPRVGSFEAGLEGVKWIAVGAAATFALYGFSWAAIMQRLP